MIRFLSSRSVADFMASLIAIEDDRLLTYYINERNEFLNTIANVYAEGAIEEDGLAHLGMALHEIIRKIWCDKYKEAGQFASTIFRIT